MRGSRFLVIGCTLASLAACSDATGPKGSASSGGGGSALPTQLVELRGVVEMVGESAFGLRWGDQQVILLYSDTDALMDALGMEVIVRGTFTSSGAFAVASVQIGADGGDELFRAPPMSRRPSGTSGTRK